MKTTLLGWLTLLAAFTLLAVPASARADKNRLDKNVDRLINTLLTARDDDDREDAAKLLGKIGGPSALVALEYAAKSDEDRGVRKDARKAAEKIRARLLA
ncbi:MAG: hypothetical protein HQ546_07735, partial [Planctomycetes bacterium]|nr:hypothetical protein [Planctomycetota bacterium]